MSEQDEMRERIMKHVRKVAAEILEELNRKEQEMNINHLWLSVLDELPPKNKRVLLLMDHETLAHGFFNGMYHDGYPLFSWWQIENIVDEIRARPTHWQPLPPPPVSDEERSAALAELLSGKFAPTPDFDVKPQMPGTTDNTYRRAAPDERDALADALIAWATDRDNAYACEGYTVPFCIFCQQLEGHADNCLHEWAKALTEADDA